jgi:hypothetical protein
MAYKHLLIASSAIALASASWASQPQLPPPPGAPAAPPEARYCLRVDPTTGSKMETIRCETRETWASMDVDVDREWAMWGVRVVTARPNG